MSPLRAVSLALLLVLATPVLASYVNFESSHVHPIALTPSGSRLLVVNTPDAVLEVFAVGPGGELDHEASVPVGLEPVSVEPRSDDEAWVTNRISGSISIVDLSAGLVTRTLFVGHEPTDVAFAGGKAFVSVSAEDRIKVYDLLALDAAPTAVDLAGLKPRALAVSADQSSVYAVVLLSGNQTTVVNANVIFGSGAGLDAARLSALGLNGIDCDGNPPGYPPLPEGIERNPQLNDPPADQHPEVGLIVGWNSELERWEDEAGQNWSHCLPYRLADSDLFVIDATTLAVTEVAGLGTTLFEVSVNPENGKIYVPNTDARNLVRFEHELGVRGHVVDNLMSVVDPSDDHSVARIDLNSHINRASDPATNLAERTASISQPGMMTWSANGSVAWLTAIGSRKLFRVDGACLSGSCIFGASRAAPAAVEVGDGPTGVVLLESAGRAYVLNRFSNSIAIVDTTAMTKLDELPLHDPSSETVREGRRFLYDGIISSRHGDAACSSCHISGDRDGLGWDLGDPTGEMVSYLTAMDNVRFIVPHGGIPLDCDALICASHAGFDPQKGPMTTQTLRAMLEPLHWRGDRATMNDFNPAFVGLMGTADIGPVDGKPAGLSAVDMETFRQFALGIQYPPNPLRNLDDTLPNADVPVPGTPFSGNPTVGEQLFDSGSTDGNNPCVACHTHPFGAAGGTTGGVTPTEPTSFQASALFNGNADQSQHSDFKVAHMRNMYEKFGPRFGDHVSADPLTVSGFGYGHDGSVPDLGTFFSIDVFTLTAQQVRDVSAFSVHFPTGTKPATGRGVTLPPGAPAKGASEDEAVLATLLALGDRADADRHCELTAAAVIAGRLERLHLDGGVWQRDTAAATPLTTTALREAATSPVSFLCGTLESGPRLGGDRDLDTVLDGDDCAAADPETWAEPTAVDDLVLAPDPGGTVLDWSDQSPGTGPTLRSHVAGGTLSALHETGLATATACLTASFTGSSWVDTRPGPPSGDGYYYLVRAVNDCGGSWGDGRDELAAADCD